MTTTTVLWAIICGAIIGAIAGWLGNSTPIGVGVLIVVGAITAFVVDRFQRRRNPRSE